MAENSFIKVDDIEATGGGSGNVEPVAEKETKIFNIRNLNDFITFEKVAVVPYTDAADSNYYTTFYAPNVRCFFIEARLRHEANGGAAAAVRIEKLPNTTARGSGQSMTDTAFDITASANNVQLRKATNVLSVVQLGPGDAVALRASGTLTNAQHVVVTALFGINLKDIPVGQSATTILSGLI